MVGSARLAQHSELARLWQRADRGWRHGRDLAARRIWRRALRTARALKCVEQLLDRPHGLPLTPPRFSRRAASRRSGLLVHAQGTTVRTGRAVVDGLIRIARPGLVVDTTRRLALIAGREVSLAGHKLLLDSLAALVAAGGGPLDVQALFARAWGRRYNGEFDRNALDYHFGILRRLLSAAGIARPVLISRGGAYMLAPGLRPVLVEAANPRPPADEIRDPTPLLRDRRIIDNRGYRELCGVSRVTAMRQLRALVKAGVLVRVGDGRGARYRFVEPPGQPSGASAGSAAH